MGLSDLPAIFHNIMQELIGSMPNCFFYMDDILLFDKDFESHKANLIELLIRLHKAGLTIHPSKTEITVKEDAFLGFKITKAGISNNQHNIDKVIEMEQPVYSKGLKRTLGLLSYMRRYVKGYTKLSACIYDKIKGDKNLAHTDEQFKDLNILPIHKLMLQRVSLQMFKYSRNTLPEVISELFITNDTFHSHNTRNKNKLRSKMSNREYMCKNFSFIGVYIWNDIQDHIPTNTSYSKFKSNTKNYFQYNNINYRIA